MSGYSLPGLISNEIETVSLVLHFSIPETLNNDEVSDSSSESWVRYLGVLFCKDIESN